MFWRQRSPSFLSLWPLLFLIIRSAVRAQNISTNGPVPPLQWINITGLTTGSAPPALRDASIGYYDGSRTLLIFGGESAQGIPQSQTFLLNLDSLAWAQNSPPDGLNSAPPARSAAISGDDFASSYRSAHIIIGGMGTNGEALSDVWEFDYGNQFWSQVQLSPGGPSARYAAVGGKYPPTSYTTSPNSPTPNNSFYLAGGISGKTVNPLSDVWRLNVTGTLSSNNPNSVEASWQQITGYGSGAPSKVGAAGAVVSSTVSETQEIISFGGCTSSDDTTPSESCASSEAYMIHTNEDNIGSSNTCPVPRIGATVVPNINGDSSDFNNQVFVVFGLYNSSLWSDEGGLEKGEVDVLNVETGVWSRVLPAGDPGTDGTGTPAYPSPRQGAVGLSWTSALTGSSRSSASDSIFFGGVDADGNYLNEVWILRAYNAQLTQTNQSWTNSSGQLVGGVNAAGHGVTVQFMTQCAIALSPAATQTPTSSGGASPTASTIPESTPTYDTSVVHKALSPISLALVFPAVIGARLSVPSVTSMQPPGHVILAVSSILVAVAAYALGVAGLATSFTSITSPFASTTLSKRSSQSSLALKTGHGKSGLVLFIIFYGILPLLFAVAACYQRPSNRHADHNQEETTGNGRDSRPRLNSTETGEKEALCNGRAASPLRSSETPLDKPRVRTRSWAHLNHLGMPGRRSSESTHDSAAAPTPPHRSFEVVNRPARTRRASGNSLAAFSDPRRPGSPRNLGDTSWFDGRRSMSVMGEPNYPLNELNHRPDPSTPGTTILDMTSTSGLMPPAGPMTPEMPRSFDIFLHVLFHTSLLALCIISLIQLWSRAPRAAFVVFLIGTLLFYIALLALSWSGKPRYSVLTVLLARLRGHPTHTGYTPGNATPSRPLSASGSEIPFPTEQRSPYQHYPPYRAASTVPDEYPPTLSHLGHAVNEVNDDDDEEDEDTRQRRIEEEMNRRDVSIVTVPRRKLFLTNPELDRG